MQCRRRYVPDFRTMILCLEVMGQHPALWSSTSLRELLQGSLVLDHGCTYHESRWYIYYMHVCVPRCAPNVPSRSRPQFHGAERRTEGTYERFRVPVPVPCNHRHPRPEDGTPNQPSTWNWKNLKNGLQRSYRLCRMSGQDCFYK